MDGTEVELIAPCGMNCRLCMAYQREKRQCRGCNGDDASKMQSCLRCIIKNCPTIASNESGFCYECKNYPCARLKQLDKRYRTNYHMSMLENLESIKNSGMETFLKEQKERWTCPACKDYLSVHRDACLKCGSIHFKS